LLSADLQETVQKGLTLIVSQEVDGLVWKVITEYWDIQIKEFKYKDLGTMATRLILRPKGCADVSTAIRYLNKES